MIGRGSERAQERELNKVKITDGKIKAKITEEMNEVAYIDQIYLKAYGEVDEKLGLIWSSRELEKLKESDDNYLVLKKGDEVYLEFEAPTKEWNKINVVAEGYYERKDGWCQEFVKEKKHNSLYTDYVEVEVEYYKTTTYKPTIDIQDEEVFSMPSITFSYPTVENNMYVRGIQDINVTASSKFNVTNITIYFDGFKNKTCTFGNEEIASCNWEWNTNNFADGSTHNFTAETYDTVGNYRTTETRFVTVDNTKPFVEFINPTPTNGSLVKLTKTINVNTTDNVAGVKRVEIYVDGLNIYNCSYSPSQSQTTCQWEWNTIQYNDGWHNISVKSFDYVYDGERVNGNVNETYRMIKTDNTHPKYYNLQYDPRVDVDDKNTVIRVNVTDNFEIDDVWIYINYPNGTKINKTMTMETGSVSSAIYNYTLDYSELGNITFRIFMNDTVNNMNWTSIKTIQVQNISIGENFDHYVNPNQVFWVSGYVKTPPDNNPVVGENVNFYVDGNFIKTCPTDGSGLYNCSLNVTEDGFSSLDQHVLKVNITNSDGISGGNQSVFYVESLTVDNLVVHPTTQTPAPAHFNYSETINITGHVKNDRTGLDSANTNVTWYVIGTGKNGTATTDANGNFEINFVGDLGAGNYTLRINKSKVEDQNGILNDEPIETWFVVYNQIQTTVTLDPASGGEVSRYSGCEAQGIKPNITWSLDIRDQTGAIISPTQVTVKWKQGPVYQGTDTTGVFDIPNNEDLALDNDKVQVEVYKSGYYYNYTYESDDYKVYGVLNSSGSWVGWPTSGGEYRVDNFGTEYTPELGANITQDLGTNYTVYDKLGDVLAEGTNYTLIRNGDWYAGDNFGGEVITAIANFTGVNNFCGFFEKSQSYRVYGKIDTINVSWIPSGNKIDRFSGGPYGGPTVTYTLDAIEENLEGGRKIVPSTNYTIYEYGVWDASNTVAGATITPKIEVRSKLDNETPMNYSIYFWHDNQPIESRTYWVYGNLSNITIISPDNETEIYACCFEPNETMLEVSVRDDWNEAVTGADTKFLMPEGEMTASDTGNGHYSYNYNPDNNLGGWYQWRALINKSYYHPANSSFRWMRIIGVNLNFTNVGPGSVLNRGMDEYLEARITDENGDGLNASGRMCEWYIDETNLANTTIDSNGYCNYTWSIPQDFTLGEHNLTVKFSEKEEIIPIKIYGWASVDGIIAPSEILTSGIAKIVCKVYDANSTNGIENYTVRFHGKVRIGTSEFSGTNETNSSGYAVYYWDSGTSASGTYDVTCNITNDDDVFYNSTSKDSNSTVVIVSKKLKIAEIYKDFNEIYRNDTYTPYRVKITAKVEKGDTGDPASANVFFYTPEGKLINSTNSSGYAYVYYNPSDTRFPGNYTIEINATDQLGEWDDSSTVGTWVFVKGVLGVKNYSLREYGQEVSDVGVNETVEIWTQDFTDLSVDRIWAVIGKPDGSEETKYLTERTGFWNGSFTPIEAGKYNVTLFINDTTGFENSSFVGYLNAWNKTTGILRQEPHIISIRTRQGRRESFLLNLTLENTGNGTMKDAKLYLGLLPDGWESENLTQTEGFEIRPGETHTAIWNISVVEAGAPGNYSISGKSLWTNPDLTPGTAAKNRTNITILENPILNVSRTEFSHDVNHSSDTIIDYVFVNSTGNYFLDKIFFNKTFGNLPESWIRFVSNNQNNYIQSIQPGSFENVSIEALIPSGQPPGTYSSIFVVNATNSTQFCSPSGNCWKFLNITLEVLEDWSWKVAPVAGWEESIGTKNSGVLGIANITNTGNMNITFSITKEGNVSSLIIIPSSITVEGNSSVGSFYVNYSIPEGQVPGKYTGYVDISNSTANPTLRKIPITITVVDSIPPKIENATLSKGTIEANYESIKLSCDASDNIGINTVWGEIEYPGGKENVTLLHTTGNNYEIDYTPHHNGGIYNVTFYVNDTSGNINQTDEHSFTVIGRATASMERNVSSVTATGITIENNYTFPVKINITNIGSANSINNGTMRYVNVTISFVGYTGFDNAGIYPSPYPISCGNISVDESCVNTINIDVTSMAAPSTIFMNINTTWKNPDNTIEYLQQQTTINIEENTILRLDKSYIEENISHGSWKQVSYDVIAYGNQKLEGVKSNSSGGTLPSSWVVEYKPNNFEVLKSQIQRAVLVNISIPRGQSPGYYWTNITSNATGSTCSPSSECWDSLILNVTVPWDKSWNVSPSSQDIQAYVNANGNFTVTIENTGNKNVTYKITKSGDATARDITSCPSNIMVPAAQSRDVVCNYTVPESLTGGTYTLTLVFYNSTYSDPTTKTSDVTYYVSDPAPKVENTTVEPAILDQNYEHVVIESDVWDNAEINHAWVNITEPNGSSIIEYYHIGDKTYHLTHTFTPHQTGTYHVRVYANDSSSQINTSEQMSFESIGTTSMNININVTQPIVNGITQISGKNIPINVTLEDTGQGSAYSSNLTVTTPTNWTSSPSFVDFGNITEGEGKSEIITVSVPSGTLPGIYTVTLTSQWTNPDNTLGQSQKNIQFNVTRNPVIDIVQYPWSINVKPSDEISTHITLNSTGNYKVDDINISCVGDECTNFSVEISPSHLDYLNVLESRDVSINFTIPEGYPVGQYDLKFDSNGKGTSDSVTLTINVGEDWRWNVTPDRLNATVGTTSGIQEFGKINITNLGNIPITFDLSKSGNISNYVILNETIINVGSLETKQVTVYYNTSDQNGTFSGNILISNSSAQPNQMNVSLTLDVLRIMLGINSPTHESPIKVRYGDVVTINASLSFAGSPIDEATWEIKFGDESCPVSNSAYKNGWWLINCTAPNITDATNYTLKVFGTSQTGITEGATAINSEPDAIIYMDVTPPRISNAIIPSVEIGKSNLIEINATDNSKVDEVILEIKYPNGTRINNTMTFENGLWKYNFTDTKQIGDYDLKIYAKDDENNTQTYDSWFEVYQKLPFSGLTQDSEGNYRDVEFKFYRNDKPKTSEYLIHSFTSDGIFSTIVHNRTYDVVTDIGNYEIEFNDVPINKPESETLIVDDVLPTWVNIPDTRVKLRGFAINQTLSFKNATVCINYNDMIGNVQLEDNVKIYKCSDWNFNEDKCDSGWEKLTTSVDKTNHIACAVTTSTSAYFAAEQTQCADVNESCSSMACCSGLYCCGGICSASPCPTTSTVSSGGGGGGGGSGGGSGGTSTNESVPGKPIEFSREMIDVTLHPGEYQIFPLGIVNNLNQKVTVDLSVEGRVWEFTQFEKTSVEIDKKSTEYVDVKFFALSTTLTGTYLGNIVIKYGNNVDKIPVRLNVVKPKEALLDVTVDAMTPKIPIGGTPTFRVTIYAFGEVKTVDVEVTYTIEKADVKEKIMSDKETLAVDRRLSYTKSFKLPSNIEPGRYLLTVDGHYENKSATAITSFEVYQMPIVFTILLNAFSNWITYIIILIIVINYYGFKYYQRWQAKKKSQRKYVFPLDFKKLPKGVKIGKIAETDVDARWDLNKLTQHMIVAGGTGSGKTVGAMVIAEEALLKGIPVIVFDPTAQWTGFVRPCRDEDMLKRYPEFGMKREEARGFKGNILDITDPDVEVDIKKYLNKGEITVFCLNKMTPSQLDKFVVKTIDSIFKVPWEESKNLRLLIVYDEVHRLLPKYGGKSGYKALERGVREFRKWGIGLIMISQVIKDFRETVRAVISSEVQMRTKYEKDVVRIKEKYGEEFAKSLPRLETGTALIQNPEFNEGRPWFVRFRPLLHNTARISEKELALYKDLSKRLSEIESRTEKLKKKGIDTYDIEIEIKLAKEKIKQTQFRMAETYIESLENRIKKLEGGK
ncbi:MAG: DUF853 family protein [Candidatus Aenigmarchaeota archaeon]|nr:DUF853 family protein [Candidatus Aenigmarchaeota archaeon]